MAALRLLTRSTLSAIILRSTDRLVASNDALRIIGQFQKRWGSYKSSPKYENPSQYTDYEITKDPKEWEYVQCLLKPKVIPIPPLEKQQMPSGWVAPTAKPKDYPYYIQRTKNYMQPVYLEITYRGQRKITYVGKIHGDIWKLESELKTYLKENTGKLIGVRVNELTGVLQFRGDYVSLVKKWLDSKGF